MSVINELIRASVICISDIFSLSLDLTVDILQTCKNDMCEIILSNSA